MPQPKVSALSIFPIKSTAGISLQQAWIDDLGFSFDRRFVICDNKGQFITGRSQPKLCLVQSSLTETGIRLIAPNMLPLTLTYLEFSQEYKDVNVWGDTIAGQVCSAKANSWFSEYLQQECTLLFFGEKSFRERKPNTEKARKLAFADGYPLLLISQASLDDLNNKLMKQNLSPVSMAQFRPNIVVDDTLPFDEDGWQRIRIGDIDFKVSKPCERCIFTTINPETGEQNLQVQPLKTLQSYRQSSQGEVLFGQNLIPLNQGKIELGDKVTILSTQPPVKLKAVHTLPDPQAAPKAKTKTLTLRCQQIINETHDVKTFIFAVPDKFRIRYLPGQHINFTLDMHGSRQPCCYTIASAPVTPNETQISITIKRVENGKVSNFFHDHFNIGDNIIAQKPSGQFHLPDDIPEKILLLSAGSGITPMLSMLRYMAAKKTNNRIVFFHSAHSEQDLIAKDEVAQLANKHGNCQVIYTLTQQVKPQWQDYQGRLSKQMLANIPELTQHQVYVCGPEGFRQSAQQHLRQLGLQKQQYHWESFGARPSSKAKLQQKTASDSSKKQQLTLHFDKWHKDYQGDNQATILEHGENAGLILPYSCRAGMCGNCKAKLIKGQVSQGVNLALTEEEKKQGYILCCTSKAQTDIVIKHN
jgi:uncharacterized protein YcbX/ferredoxin-NADP reductase